MRLLYTLAIHTYGLAIRIAALFNPKAKAWVHGRHHWASRLEKQLGELGRADQPLVWMHCASLGEFEQGRPVLEALRESYPHLRIVLSFFSPSGYELRKDYAHADLVTYLPLDTPANAKKWAELLNPQLVIFVKYEFWFHHLQALAKRGSPALLISALFRPSQPFFKPWGGLFRRMLQTFDQIFVQDQSSADLLTSIGLEQAVVSGDNRIDRVATLARSTPEYPLVARFADDKPVMVIGSNWPQDDRILLPFLLEGLPDEWKAILAPHDLHAAYLEKLHLQLGAAALRYSEATPDNMASARFLLIDNVGMLAGIYRYGKIAYIGGGFGSGIHNTLEPAAHGLPVLFGPKHQHFREAGVMKAREAAFPVNTKAELVSVFRQLNQGNAAAQAGARAKAYIASNSGATARVMKYINTQYRLWSD